MIYYGIKTPINERVKSYIHWISSSEHDSWFLFFNQNPHRLPICDAIEAYKSIGYKCVKLEVNEIE